MATERELQRLAARQHGLASRQQLLRLGFTSRQITGRVAREVWRRAAPCVYDVVPGSFDRRRPLHATVLSAGAWASHRSAGELLGYVDLQPARPAIVIANDRCLVALDADIHRSLLMAPTERTTVDGIACTSAVPSKT